MDIRDVDVRNVDPGDGQAPMSSGHAPLLTVDGRGQVMSWSDAAERLLSRRAADALGRTVVDVLATLPEDGRWLLARVPDRPDGAVWGVWRAERDVAALDEAVLDAVFTQSSVGLHVLDRSLRLVRVNAYALGVRGLFEEEIVGRPVVDSYGRVGIPVDESILREVLRTGRPARDMLKRFHPPADPLREHIFSVSIYRHHDRTGEPLGLVVTAVDVTEREQARERLNLLHTVRERIGTSLDVGRTAAELVDVTVPAFADSALVALTDVVLHGGSPDLPPRGSAPLLRCAATGGRDTELPHDGVLLLPGLFGEELPTVPTLPPPGPEGPVALRIVAPLTVRGQFLGVVDFRRAPGSEPYTSDDLVLAGGIAARTATCLENALRFTREHIVMTALQSWPLRQEASTHRAVEVAQRHRPGGSGAGSWYDVISLPGARVGLVVGQVEQPGLSAVATMSRLRTAVHSLATLDLDPHELLARLHATTLQLAREASPAVGAEDTTASCTYVVHDPVSGRIDAAGAGGSLFAVVRPDGSVDIDPLGRAPLLGAEGPPFAFTTQVLPEESILCLASAPSADGQGPMTEQLVTALGHPGNGREETADAVEALLARDRVLLVARTLLLPESDLDEWPVLPDASAVGPARRHVDERLAHWGIAVDTFAVSVVVSELVTNAIRYGAAPITLRLIRGERTLICEVTDSAPTAPHLRHAKAVDEGGRGLQICGSLAESWGVRYVGEGKTVWAEIGTEGAG
ncbi:SpoIIE family protein phosphatase [Streptomyces sp. NPDC002057]|uniref:SpoIIE family protein phosphatase n=1 Tax=Streptomyces sp. NPDC002057 TaxID=3154664 RepID=UPI00331BFB79